jgi:hypothetical protein
MNGMVSLLVAGKGKVKGSPDTAYPRMTDGGISPRHYEINIPPPCNPQRAQMLFEIGANCKSSETYWTLKEVKMRSPGETDLCRKLL